MSNRCNDWQPVHMFGVCEKAMTARLCKFCKVTMLDGFDEEQHKFIEADTRGLHTRDRCEAAKARQEQKDDHGNENEQSMGQKMLQQEVTRQTDYVDHTQGQKEKLKLKLKLKIFTDPNPDGLMLIYNNFAEWNAIKFSQYQIAGSLYTIAVWYEEETGKQ